MGSRMKLGVTLLAVGVAAVLVWQLATLRGGTAQERAESVRGGAAGRAAEGEPGSPSGASAAEPPGEMEPPGLEAGEADVAAGGVRVRVVAAGRPLADAYVYVITEDGLALDAGAGDEPGVFVLEMPGELTVLAAHARYGPARTSVRAKEGEFTEVTLELPEGHALDILVVDDRGGAPVAGAEVVVLRAGSEGGIDGFNARLQEMLVDGDDPDDVDFSLIGQLDLEDFMQLERAPAVALERLVTDGAGRVRVAGLPPGTVDLVVSHPDYVGTRLRKQPVGAGREAVARLSAGGSLTVIAPFVDGRAAEGYGCWIVRPGLMFGMPIAMKRIDAQGRAHFSHLPPGPVRVSVGMGTDVGFFGAGMRVEEAEPPPGEPGTVAAEGTEEPGELDAMVEEKPLAAGAVVIAKGEHRTLDLRGQVLARIEGVYLVGSTPREGAVVVLLGGEGFSEQVGMAETDETGMFLFEGVEPGRYRVAGVGETGGIARAGVEVKPGAEVVKVRLELPTGAIVGRVLDAEGKPAVDGRVLVVPRDGAAGGGAANLGDLLERVSGFGEADADGRYWIAGLAAGEYRVLGAAGRRLDVTEVTLRDGEEAQVEFRLDDTRLRRLIVRLSDEKGEPVDGIVTIVGAAGGVAESLALMMDEEAEEQLTGEGGSPTHEFFLGSGRYRVIASRRGLAPVLGELVDMRANRELNLTLGPGVSVEVALTGPDGAVANREVDVRNEHGIRLGSHSPVEIMLAPKVFRTDGGGVLTLANVPPGRYTLLIDGKAVGTVDVGRSPVTQRIRVD